MKIINVQQLENLYNGFQNVYIKLFIVKNRNKSFSGLWERYKRKSNAKDIKYTKFIKALLKYRYDKIFLNINLKQYDKRNPPLFVCKKCKGTFTNGVVLHKHKTECNKKVL